MIELWTVRGLRRDISKIMLLDVITSRSHTRYDICIAGRKREEEGKRANCLFLMALTYPLANSPEKKKKKYLSQERKEVFNTCMLHLGMSPRGGWTD